MHNQIWDSDYVIRIFLHLSALLFSASRPFSNVDASLLCDLEIASDVHHPSLSLVERELFPPRIHVSFPRNVSYWSCLRPVATLRPIAIAVR